MNHSFYSIDRTTHLKIVALALIAATAVAGIGIAAHSGGGDGLAQSEPAGVLKIRKPATMTPEIQLAAR
jgi:hypothetical protein